MEEPVFMSDEETSDSEVIFVDKFVCPPSQTETAGTKEQPKEQSKVVTEEMRIDEQLKELGLYEEGMSMEQKQELLVVLAASRETAEQEESMRQRAIEWERQLFSDTTDGVSSYETSGDGDDNWKSDASKITSTAYGRNSLPPVDANKGTKSLSVNKAEESYSQKVKFTEKAFKMLEVDESSKTSESQDQKPVNTSTISTDQFYPHSTDLSFPAYVNSQRRSSERIQRGKHHLSRNAYRPLSPSSSKVAVAHPMIRDPVNEIVVREEDSSLSPFDYHRIKFKLDKSLSSWEPCTSPVAFELTCKRPSPKHSLVGEYVPFFCPENCSPKEYTAVILNSFKKYHHLLRKIQARSKKHMQWGEPVKVGRHHLDSLDALTTPRHQVKVRNFDRREARILNRSNVEVSYSEMENKECNEDSAMLNIDKCPEPNTSDSNAVERTMKSAFRPIKTPLQLIDKENDPVQISDYELHDSDYSKMDTLPRSKSCPSPVASDSDATATKMDEKCKRTLLSNLNCNKQLEDPGGREKENAAGFHQWSPFAPISAPLLNSDIPNSNAFSTFATAKTVPSTDNAHFEHCDTASEKTEASEIENNIFDSQFHVRKDGQKTYSSRPHHKAGRSLGVVSSPVVETCDNSQEMSGISSQESAAKYVPPTEDKSTLKTDEMLLSQIEEGGISRKRKCELRLTRLTASEIRAACPRKRWKKQS